MTLRLMRGGWGGARRWGQPSPRRWGKNRCMCTSTMRNVLAAVCGLILFGPMLARASDCPGNPDALGTSRTIVVDPTEHPRLGSMQYHESLPLEDHEVVITFDDGPLPPRSTRALAIPHHHCLTSPF